jgi:tetratricopeptide (TPR) repeat protein
LARLHGQMFWFPQVDPVPERRTKALAALATAQRLAPNAPETHAATGALAYTCDNDWHRALAEFRLAEPGLPNDAQLQLEAGLAHRRLGQWQETLARLGRAVTLNPHVGAMNAMCGTLFVLRRYAETKDAATRFTRFFPDDGVVQRYLAQARYALDGDRAAFVRAWTSSTPSKNDQGGLRLVYQAAVVEGDLVAASRILADTRITSLPAAGGALLEPVQLRRAMIAYLQGDKQLAREFADEAAAAIRRQTWMPRQQPSAKLAMAEAAAYAGRGEEAVREGQAALAEYGRFDEFDAKENGAAALGRIYVVLGRKDDALQLLRKAMSEPGPAPFTIRHDPVWSLLKDDLRFEEILSSAKAF